MLGFEDVVFVLAFWTCGTWTVINILDIIVTYYYTTFKSKRMGTYLSVLTRRDFRNRYEDTVIYNRRPNLTFKKTDFAVNGRIAQLNKIKRATTSIENRLVYYTPRWITQIKWNILSTIVLGMVAYSPVDKIQIDSIKYLAIFISFAFIIHHIIIKIGTRLVTHEQD